MSVGRGVLSGSAFFTFQEQMTRTPQVEEGKGCCPTCIVHVHGIVKYIRPDTSKEATKVIASMPPDLAECP